MPKYHNNPETGKANVCTAKIKCKFTTEDGVEPPHFATKEEAAAAYETKMAGEAIAAPMKATSSKKSLKKLPGDKLSYADNAKALADRKALLETADNDTRLLSGGVVGIANQWDDSSVIAVTFDAEDDQKIFLMKKNGEWVGSIGWSPDIDNAKPFYDVLTDTEINWMARENSAYPYYLTEEDEGNGGTGPAGPIKFRIAQLMEDHDASVKPTVSMTPARYSVMEDARFELQDISNGAIAVKPFDDDGSFKLQFVSDRWDIPDAELVIREKDGVITGQMMNDEVFVDAEMPIEKSLTAYNVNYHARGGNKSYPYDPTIRYTDEEDEHEAWNTGERIVERVKNLIELNSMSNDSLAVRARLLEKELHES